jgi:hypothetical protein
MKTMSIRNKTTKRMLLSSFNGMPAPGGTYDDKTKVYCKKLAAKAYFWPMKGFPVDKPIVDQLRELSCETMVLVVTKPEEEADMYMIDFETFLRDAKAIDWPGKGDRRFPVRLYLPLNVWQKIEGRAA